jgi:hypothetical protein
MKKIDLKKELKYLYTPSAKEVELVKVPKFNFLKLNGHGNPNTSKEFQDAVQALYSICYTIKFKIKFEKGIEYPVMPLEGLWWIGDDKPFNTNQKGDWRWTLMILQPNIVTKLLVVEAKAELKKKKDLASLECVRLESFSEDRSAQTMHLGPYGDEPATIRKLEEFARDRGLQFCGKHHEIYLSNPARVKPEKMRTIVRYPVHRGNP